MKQVISFSFSSDLINLINSIPKNERSKKIVDKLTAFGLSLSDDEVYEINLVIKF